MQEMHVPETDVPVRLQNKKWMGPGRTVCMQFCPESFYTLIKLENEEQM